jgi:hypothetical protein
METSPQDKVPGRNNEARPSDNGVGNTALFLFYSKAVQK